jgi:hypothetical protein
MPKQLPVISLSTLLANSQYVKESQYTPRRTRKRRRSSGSTGNGKSKQTPAIQPAGAPVPLPDGSHKQGVPAVQPPVMPHHPDTVPAHQAPITVQHTVVSVQVDVHIENWQQQEAARSRPAAAPQYQQPIPPYQAPVSWNMPPSPPTVWPYSPQPPPEKPMDWAVIVVSFVVALICGVFAGCLFEVFF